MLADVPDAGGNVVADLAVIVHEQPLAETVAAIRPADLVAQQQHGVVVLVLHALSDGYGLLVAGIELAPVVQLLDPRNDELFDRVVRVVLSIIWEIKGIERSSAFHSLALDHPESRNSAIFR